LRDNVNAATSAPAWDAREEAVSAAPSKHAFMALDGLRGIAALSVVIFHVGQSFGFHLLPRAYLAVDFFFMLSGFVVAHAYDKRLIEGRLPLKDFAVVRLVRLYPMYALSMLFAVVAINIQAFLGITHEGRIFTLVSFLTGLFFLPTFMAPSGPGSLTFPLNAPAWSLSSEVGINFIYAAIVRYISSKALVCVIAIAAASLMASVYYYHDLGGDRFATYSSGWARVAFSFPAGVLFYRILDKRPRGAYSAWVLVFMSAAVLEISNFNSTSLLATSIEIFVLFPIIIWFCAQVILQGPLERMCGWFGEISYPLYIIHIPLVHVLLVFDRKLFGTTSPNSYSRLSIYILIAVSAAWWLSVAFDRPVRARLRSKLFARAAG
jgi:peptidoglycan/LPS O-acetylase OafA/YrhL